MLTIIKDSGNTEVTNAKIVTSAGATDVSQALYWNGTEWSLVYPTGPVFDDYYSLSADGLLTITPAFRTAIDNNTDYKSWTAGDPLPNPNEQGNVKSMYGLFENFIATNLDLSLWDFSTVTNFASMFKNCSRLLEMTFIDKTFSTELITVREMFNYCSKLTNLAFINCSTMKISDMTSFHFAGSTDTAISITNMDLTYIAEQDDPSLLMSYSFSSNNTSISNVVVTRSSLEAGLINDYGNIRPSVNYNRYATAYPSLLPYYTRIDSFSDYGSISIVNAFKVAIKGGIDYITEEGRMWVANTSLPNPNPDGTLKTMSSLFQYVSTNANTLYSYIDLSDFVFTGVQNFSNMFRNARLTTLILPTEMDFSSGINFGGMFREYSTLQSLDLSDVDMSNAEDVTYMFEKCSSLADLQLGVKDWSKVTSLTSLFYGCSKLTNITLTDILVGNVTSLYQTFYGCSLLTSIVLPKMPKVTTYQSIFENCVSLTTFNIVPMEGETEPLSVSFHRAFYNCTSIVNIDLSAIFVSSVSMAYVCYKCSALTSFIAPRGVDVRVTTFGYAFQNCTVLPFLDFTSYSSFPTSGYGAASSLYAFSGANALTGGFTGSFASADALNNRSHTSLKTGSYFNFNDPITEFYNVSSGRLTLNGNFKQALNSNNTYTDAEGEILWEVGTPIPAIPTEVNSVYATFSSMSDMASIDLSLWDFSNITNYYRFFYGCTNITSIIFPEIIDTTEATTFSNAFYNCNSIIDFDFFDKTTSLENVTTLEFFLYSCTSLANIKITKDINLPNVTILTNAFASCKALTSISFLDKMTFGNVITITGLFNSAGLTGEISIDGTKFNSSTVDEDGYMTTTSFLNNNTNITKLTLTNFKVNNQISNPNTTSNYFMGILAGVEELHISNIKFAPGSTARQSFNKMPNLTTIVSSNISMVGITDLSYTFSFNPKLVSVDLSTFETPNVTNMTALFYGCTILPASTLVNTPDTTSLTILTSAFRDCEALTNIDFLSNWDLQVLTKLNYTFYGCGGIVSVDLKNLNIPSLTDVSNMFHSCANLVDIVNSTNEKIDLPYLQTMSSMFDTCTKITNGDVLHEFNLPSLVSTSYMYDACTSVTTTNMVFDTPMPNWNEATGMFRESGLSGAFVLKNLSSVPIKITYIIESCAITSLTIEDVTLVDMNSTQTNKSWLDCYRLIDLTLRNVAIAENGGMVRTFMSEQITNIVFDNVDFSEVTSMFNAFYQCNKLTSISFENIQFSKLTNMENTFYQCSNLTSVSFKNSNLVNLIRLYLTFYNCVKLETIDFSGNDLSNLTTMQSAFKNNTALHTLTLPQNTGTNCTNMSETFYGCKLLNMDCVENLDMANVTTTKGMFTDCFDIHNKMNLLDDKIFSSLTDASYMFRFLVYADGSPTQLRLPSSFKTANITNMAYIFGINGYSPTEITPILTIDVSNMNANTLVDLQYAFANNSGLTTITFPTEPLSNVTNISGLFYNCNSLTTLPNLSTDSTKIVDISALFYNCSSLGVDAITSFFSGKEFPSISSLRYTFAKTSITNTNFLSTLDFSKIIDLGYAFQNCINLTSISENIIDANVITDLSGAFSGTGITDISFLNNKTFLNLYSMRGVISDCSNLTGNITFENSIFPKLSTIVNAFVGLVNVNLFTMNNVEFSSLTNFEALFSVENTITLGCRHVKISNVTAPKLTSLESCFNRNNNFQTVVFENVTTGVINNVNDLFESSLYMVCADFRGITFKTTGWDYDTFVGTSYRNSVAATAEQVSIINTFESAYSKCHLAPTDNDFYYVVNSVLYLMPAFVQCILAGVDYVKDDIVLWQNGTPLPPITGVGEFTNIDGIFRRWKMNNTLDLSSWDTSTITSMRYFIYEEGIPALNVLNWDTSKVTAFDSSFYFYKTDVLDLSSWDVSGVTVWNSSFFRYSTINTAYARTQADADILNSHITGVSWSFVVKPTP